MSDARRRLVLYGVAVVAGAALLFGGFGLTFPPEPGTRLNGAALLAGAGDYDQAIALCDTVLEEHPRNVDARVYRATFLSMAQRWDEAVAAYDDAIAHAEGGTLALDLRTDRAGVLLEADRRDAFQAARDALAAEGAGYRVDVLDGLSARRDGAWARAVDAFARARRARPDDEQVRARLWDAWMGKGRAALSSGALAEARDAFEAAIPLFPRAHEAHRRAAEVRLALDDVDGAIARLQEAGPQTPGIAPLVFRASVLLVRRGELEPALDALHGAFAADPAGVRALLEQEPAWRPHRAHPDVRELLEMDLEKNRADLTAPE